MERGNKQDVQKPHSKDRGDMGGQRGGQGQQGGQQAGGQNGSRNPQGGNYGGTPYGGQQLTGDATNYGGAYDPRQYNRELQQRLNDVRDLQRLLGTNDPTAKDLEGIARNIQQLMNDRNIAADQPIKQRGFSNARPPDDGNRACAFLDRFRVHEHASALTELRVRVTFRG